MLSIECMCRSCELDVVHVLTAWVIRPVIADDHTGLSKRLDSTCRVLRLPAASLRISCGPSLHVDRVSSIRVSAGLVACQLDTIDDQVYMPPLAIGHFLLVVLWNQSSISNGFRDIQWRI